MKGDAVSEGLYKELVGSTVLGSARMVLWCWSRLFFCEHSLMVDYCVQLQGLLAIPMILR